MGELFQDTSESQSTSEDDDDSSVADTVETALLRSRASREGSTSTIKASRSVEAREGTTNEKIVRPTPVLTKVVQEST